MKNKKRSYCGQTFIVKNDNGTYSVFHNYGWETLPIHQHKIFTYEDAKEEMAKYEKARWIKYS